MKKKLFCLFLAGTLVLGCVLSAQAEEALTTQQIEFRVDAGPDRGSGMPNHDVIGLLFDISNVKNVESVQHEWYEGSLVVTAKAPCVIAFAGVKDNEEMDSMFEPWIGITKIETDWETYSGEFSYDYEGEYTQIGSTSANDPIAPVTLNGGVYRLFCANFAFGTTHFLVVEGDGESTPPPPSPPPPPTGPLDGASNWAIEELEYALDAGLLIEVMSGEWEQPTSRLLAAEAIARLVEVSIGSSIEEVAEQIGFGMNDRFADTDSRYATFLKSAGISNGVDGVNYDPSGIFTRAQMVTMLGRIAQNIFSMNLSGYPLGTDVFSDVPNWEGTNEAIGWAAALGITQGTGEGLFDSNGTLQNQHTGVFAYRAFDRAFGLGIPPELMGKRIPNASVSLSVMHKEAMVLVHVGGANVFFYEDKLGTVVSESDISDLTVYVNGIPHPVVDFTVEESWNTVENPPRLMGYRIVFGQPFTQFPARYALSLKLFGMDVAAHGIYVVDADGVVHFPN